MNTVSQLTWVFFIGMGSASSVILGKKIGAGEEEAAMIKEMKEKLRVVQINRDGNIRAITEIT